MSKVTGLDHAILGLLARGDMSGYRIRKVFEDTALGNYSSSPGSIYPALARLEILGLVKKMKKHRTIQNLYAITEKGRKQLRTWIFGKVTRDDVTRNSEVLSLRIAFMDVFNERQLKLDFLSAYKKEVDVYIKELENFSFEGKQGMLESGRFAFEYGLESIRHTSAWINKLLSFYRKTK
jgi:DNA-binding PadR family transcriptional regulator